MVTPVFAACDGVFILMAGPVLSIITLTAAMPVWFPAWSFAVAVIVTVPLLRPSKRLTASAV